MYMYQKYQKWAFMGVPSKEDFLLAEKADIVVAKDGSGDFISITDAVNNVSYHSGVPVVILIMSGTYTEKIIIPAGKKIRLVGASMERTIISGNATHRSSNYSTLKSATFTVDAKGFTAERLTIMNTAGPGGYQAVAVAVSADYVAFHYCNITGYQDTLYIHKGKQFYSQCIIEGTVDFIFGHGSAVFQGCRIIVKKPNPDQHNFITADGGETRHHGTGLSIQNSFIEASPKLASVKGSTRSTYLGRPWSAYARTAFIWCYLDQVIHHRGWMEWDDRQSQGLIEYGEYKNYGPGANTSGRVEWVGYSPQLSHEQVVQFSARVLIDGDQWLNATGFPFYLDIPF